MIKTKRNSSMMLIYIALSVLYSFNARCNMGRGKTPKAFIYKDTVDDKTYNRFKLMLADSVRSLIKEDAGPYYVKEFDEQTEIFIDSILFNPQKSRIAFFVVTKNSNGKLLNGGKENEYHYNAHSFIGDSNNDGHWKISWMNAVNLTNYSSYEKVSQRIRVAHFKLFNQRKGVDGNSLYRYNWNDKRFWEGPVWNK